MLKTLILRVLKWTAGIILVLFLSITATLYVFKDDICNLAIAQVNKYLKVKVVVSEVDLTYWASFPNLSIDFNEVFIQDSFEKSTVRDTLLYSDRIRCKFNPMDLWNEIYTIKAVEVGKGTLQLKVNPKGENNFNIVKETSDSVESDGFELNLNSIYCEEMRFSYSNHATQQVYETEIAEIEINGALNTGKFTAQAQSEMKILQARSGNVNLVRNQPARLNVSIVVNSEMQTVVVPKSLIHIANLPFNFDVAYDTTGFNFNLSAHDIQIDEAANRLALSETENVKSFKGQGKLLFDLNIRGSNESTAPAVVNCSFGIKNGNLIDPNSGVSLSKIELDGAYSNKGGKKLENLTIKKASFNSTGGQFSGKLKLTNFEQPLYDGNASGRINLAIFQSFVNISSIETILGFVDLNSSFLIQAKPKENEAMGYEIRRCDGQMELDNVEFKLTDDQRHYKRMNGVVYLRNDEVGLENVQAALGNSDFKVNGVFKNFASYLSQQGKLVADVEIRSKNIYISDLGAESKEEHIQQERVFMLPDDIDARVFLDVKKMNYEEHNFYQLMGNMSVEGRTIYFPRIGLRSGGADITGTLSIQERRPEIFYVGCQMMSNNIEFKSLFEEWDNFNQEVISSKNISGNVQANLLFEAPFDLRSGIISDAIEAQIGIKITNGRLKNVETFKDITESLRTTSSARMAIGKENIDEFEKKLLDLRFDELENTLVIKNSVMTIPTMSIKSNALDVEASGKHTFDNKIDYRFGFRFRDLKVKKESEFGEIIDDGTGKYVFMRMYGTLDNPIIEWDKVSNQEKRKEYNEKEVQNTKSMLKSEFGLFKNDTTVKKYIHEKRPHEVIEIDFNPVDQNDTLIPATKPKKDTKARKMLDKWKKEAEEAKKEEIDFD